MNLPNFHVSLNISTYEIDASVVNVEDTGVADERLVTEHCMFLQSHTMWCEEAEEAGESESNKDTMVYLQNCVL